MRVATIDLLPTDVLKLIVLRDLAIPIAEAAKVEVRQLHNRRLRNRRLVCRKWRDIIDKNDTLWQQLCTTLRWPLCLTAGYEITDVKNLDNMLSLVILPERLRVINKHVGVMKRTTSYERRKVSRLQAKLAFDERELISLQTYQSTFVDRIKQGKPKKKRAKTKKV